MGFNPVVGNEGRPKPIRAHLMGPSGAGPFPKVRVGGFVTNAFGDGAAVSPREVELVLRRLHAWNAEGPLARQSTLRKSPIVR